MKYRNIGIIIITMVIAVGWLEVSANPQYDEFLGIFFIELPKEIFKRWFSIFF